MNHNRWIALFLAVMMLLAVPCLSFASERSNVTFTLDSENVNAPGLVSLVNTISFNVMRDEDASLLAVLINGNEIVELVYKINREGLYFRTSLTGNDTYYIPWKWVASKAAELAALYTAIPVSEEIVEGVLQNTVELFLGETDIISVLQNISYFASISEDEADSTEASLTGEALEESLDTFTALLNRAVTTEGEYTAEDMNPAKYKTTLTITNEDFVNALCGETFTSLLDSILPTLLPMLGMDSSDGLDTESFISLLNVLVEQINFLGEVNLYSTDTEICGEEVSLRTGVGTDEEKLVAAVRFAVQDVDAGRKYQVNASFSGEELLNANCMIGANGDISAKSYFSLLDTISFGLSYDHKTEAEGSFITLSYYQGENAKNFSQPVATMNIHNSTVMEAVSSVLNTKAPRDFSTFGDEDFKALSSTIAANATGLAVLVLQNLPEDSLSLFSNIYGQ